MGRSVGILSVKEDSQGMAGKSLTISCQRFRIESEKDRHIGKLLGSRNNEGLE